MDIFGSISSSLIMVGGVIWQNIALIPIGVIILTAFMTHFNNRLSQNNIRKYEQKRLAVTEALGPIYGHLIQVVASYDRTNQGYSTYAEMDLTGTTYDIWSKIRHNYQFYLIPEDLRNELEKFYLEYETYREMRLNHVIMSISNKICERRYKKKLRDQPSFSIMRRDGDITKAWYFGLVFWKVKSTKQINGKLKKIVLNWATSGGSTPDQKVIRNGEAESFETKFLQEVWAESDKDFVITNARKTHKHLHKESERLKKKIEEKISEWAS